MMDAAGCCRVAGRVWPYYAAADLSLLSLPLLLLPPLTSFFFSPPTLHHFPLPSSPLPLSRYRFFDSVSKPALLTFESSPFRTHILEIAPFDADLPRPRPACLARLPARPCRRRRRP